ncbi:MAG: hypothetical protein IIT96_07010 [Muribaculaceae bacterium]|nr:hypothetical protein [Muribaculaceae bacterium]
MVSRIKKIRILDEMAKFISTMLSPLLTPTYGTLMALSITPKLLDVTGARFKLLLIVFALTCIFPMITIAVLHNFKVIKDKRMISRKERLIPYITGTIYYAVAVYHVIYTHEPRWLVMFFAGGALACLISTVVNCRWKISAHMAGMGGLVALLWQINAMELEIISSPWMMLYILLAIFLSGMLGSARLLLKRHTLPQVLAGFLNGLICVSLMMRLFG